MHLELLLSNEQRVLPSVRAFIHETLLQLPLTTKSMEQLEQLAIGAVTDAIDHAYPSAEEGLIKLTITEKHGKLEFLVRDFGLPQDVQLLERQLHASESPASRLFGCYAADVVDEMHWLAFGPQGKALQIIKWLHTSNVADSAQAENLARFQDDVQHAPEQEYTVRRMLPEEAVQVSQLMYRTYGNTYFNEDVYYPDRIAAQNAHQVLVSFVAQGEDGHVAGHCALELTQEGPVAELGQAVVDPAHRGRGLLDRMKDAILEEADRLGLVGWYADAVAVHTLTQKSNVHHGGHLTGVQLGISPKTEAFRSIAEQQPQRVTCLLYFHWLKRPLARTIYVPDRHREIASAIYENLQCPMQLGKSETTAAAHGTLAVKIDVGAARAFVRAERLGKDTVHSICHAKRELVEQSHVEVVFAELPLQDPATPQVADELEYEGLAFAGVAPHFSSHGDLLRLVYLVEPLVKGPIKAFEPFADRLVEYALSEQSRLRDAL
jgi:anti-sigma regulatory factor (Ser/Thr protein kinase)/GNAT superfamily N-acetyltransferase